MKINNLFIAAAVVLAASSCQKNEQANNMSEYESGKTGYLSVCLSPAVSVETKASSYTDLESAESKINTAQLFICKQDGSLARYLSKSNVGSGPVVFDGFSLPVGQYKVHAVINGHDLSSCLTESEILNQDYFLSENSGGFVQYAMKSCTVSEGQNASCQVQAARLCSRVHVESVKNNLPSSYGAVTLKNVFLENVSSSERFNMSSYPVNYINLFGRSDENNEDSLIDGTTYLAQTPEFTYKSVAASIANAASYSTPFNLYCYRNLSDYDPDYAFDGSAYQGTKLVLTVSIKGQDYYYPLFVSDSHTIEANTAYSVAITLNNIGSTDPSLPIELSAVSVSVSVANWDDGGSQDVEI